MKTKQCCYMARDCTPACVSYVNANEFSKSIREIGLSDMHCMRLFMDLAEMLTMRPPSDDEIFDEEEDI